MAAGPRFGIVFLPESLGGFAELCREAEATGSSKQEAETAAVEEFLRRFG